VDIRHVILGTRLLIGPGKHVDLSNDTELVESVQDRDDLIDIDGRLEVGEEHASVVGHFAVVLVICFGIVFIPREQ
jgi:tetrahydromethanopterin S-methyltransferase subunit F